MRPVSPVRLNPPAVACSPVRSHLIPTVDLLINTDYSSVAFDHFHGWLRIFHHRAG
jgi:hypothetical protein